MGGNALLYARTERKSKEQYFTVMKIVMEKLSKLFPATRLAVVQSIEAKESFGDGDILIDTMYLPTDWIAKVQTAFDPDELVINSIKALGRRRGGPLRFVRRGTTFDAPELYDGTHYDVPHENIPCSAVSFEFANFQIDLIVTKPEDFQIAQVYYAFNDLGNLMGRIADRMGYKFGWDGLWKNVGEGNDVYATVLVTRDAKTIFSFLGYDYEQWKLGFVHFSNMFEFAASTPWFNRAPYQFENHNHKDRVRDEKRTTYQAFVAWIEDKPWLDRHTWASYERDQVTPEREREKQVHLERAFAKFPEFQARYDEAVEDRRLANEAKKVWNGGIIGVLTGLSGEALGTFMRQCRDKHNAASFYKFDAWVIQQTPQQIETFVKDTMCEIA